ncbi:MAG: R.Pab1 family restriction endonuclease [Gammaproteobacteria bacterium]|nr:R.Pab1 family restriction endonuclease [Gammaproteobacteria bacterium]
MSLKASPKNLRIEVDIPLTRPMGKIRIKKRSDIFEYGAPFASRRDPFTDKNYVEWQISYDKPAKDAEDADLGSVGFRNGKGENKVLHELSACLFYFAKWGVLKEQELRDIKSSAEKIPASDLLAEHPDCRVRRTDPVEKHINGLRFDTLKVEYPQLVRRIGNDGMIAEITIREKQRAVGLQPMLYFCIPIAALSAGRSLIGRCADEKECAQFVFDQSNCFAVAELMRIFGMLSESHQRDVVAIIDAVLQSV